MTRKNGLNRSSKPMSSPKKVDLTPYMDPKDRDKDDDSMGAMFKALRNYHKSRRSNNLNNFEGHARKEIEEELGIKFVKHTEFHYGTVLQGCKLEFWPSSKKWRWKNHTYYGDFQSFVNWYKKRNVL